MSKNGHISLKILHFLKITMILIFYSPKATVSQKNKCHINNLKSSGCFEKNTMIIYGKKSAIEKMLLSSKFSKTNIEVCFLSDKNPLCKNSGLQVDKCGVQPVTKLTQNSEEKTKDHSRFASKSNNNLRREKSFQYSITRHYSLH